MGRVPSVARGGRRWREWRFSGEEVVGLHGARLSDAVAAFEEVVPVWPCGANNWQRRRDWWKQPCFSAGSMTRPCSGSR